MLSQADAEACFTVERVGDNQLYAADGTKDDLLTKQ
jgi:hypothetical protein